MAKLSFEHLCRRPPRKVEVEDLQFVTKEMSQLIAKSWLPEGKEIREVLLSRDSDKILKLFRDHNIDIELFAISRVEVDWTTFLGSVEDTTDPEHPLKLVVAYPPKPDAFNLNDDDLRDWVNNDEPKQKVPPHPYLPVTF